MATFSTNLPLKRNSLGFAFFKVGEFSAGTHTLILDYEVALPDISVLKGNDSIPINSVSSSTGDISVSAKVISELEIEIVIPVTGTYTIGVK